MMGLDPMGPPSVLWQEKANIEVNVAVLHSFQQARISMVDHHTAAAGFMNFWDTEHSAGRGIPFCYFLGEEE
jgi:nitric oxide synthase oxygenase domain/subunit